MDALEAIEGDEKAAVGVREAAPTLGKVMRAFKSAVTCEVRGIGRRDFGWQGNYYDHVVRNDVDLARVRDYILTNPARWAEDEFYSKDRL